MTQKQTLPSFTPLYRQVKEIIQSRIANGAWAPGQILPAEPKLGRELGVSVGTVRKALEELTNEKLLNRQQGRGTFVATQSEDSAVFHFFRLIDESGTRLVPTGRELNRVQRLATAAERAHLHLAGRAKVVSVRRLRSMPTFPLMIERIVIPVKLFPDLGKHKGDLPNALYDFYQRRYGKTVRRVSERLAAGVLTDREEAELLDLSVGAPVLEVERTAYTFDDVPLEWRLYKVDTRSVSYINEII